MELKNIKVSDATNTFIEIELMLHQIDQKAKTLIDSHWQTEYQQSLTEFMTVIDTQLQMSLHDDISKMEV